MGFEEVESMTRKLGENQPFDARDLSRLPMTFLLNRISLSTYRRVWYIFRI